jgi:hypothetical protein
MTVRRMPFSAAAWALPRPSATASAKLANSTVNQSQRVMARMNPGVSTAFANTLASPWPASAWIKRPVVSRLPSQTTNMTGFLTWWRGDRRFTASQAATLSRAAS